MSCGECKCENCECDPCECKKNNEEVCQKN